MAKKCYHYQCGHMALVTCANCEGKGVDKSKKRCDYCGGSGKQCPKHGSDHGN